MITVYSRIQEYSKTSYFKFQPAGINIIGQFVAREWRQKGNTMDQLEVIQSVEIEPDGAIKHYMVYTYPESFKTNIDSIIQRWVDWCLRPKEVKNTNEKPLIKSNPPTPISYSSDPPKKERKRRPITTSQPAFSGKLLKKK